MSAYTVGQKARLHWPSGWHGDVDGVIIELARDGVQQLEVRDAHDQRAWWDLTWEDDREVVLLDQPAPVRDRVSDPVNHPAHYTGHPSGVECITITRHMNFNLGNVVKYVWRAGQKDSEPTIQDLEKARWYLNDEIARRQLEEHTDGTV